jgi:hypothetical protein
MRTLSGPAGPPAAMPCATVKLFGRLLRHDAKNLSRKQHDPLKNGGNGPIKTLDVVTGPPEGVK